VTRLLIVDDQTDVCRLLEIVLQGPSRKIRTAGNGEEAIRLARSFRPDVILLDVMMPGGVDGLQVARILKGDKKTAGSKILIITAKTQQADREDAFSAGADDFLTKPFDVLELQKKVEHLLEP